MSEAAIMIPLRLVHIISAVLWVGGVGFLFLYLLPAVRACGAGGFQIMQNMMQRKFPIYIATLPGLVILSGFAMYIRASMATHGQFNRTAQGMALGIGGVLALVALIVGGAITGRTAEALTKLGAQILASGAPPSPAQAQEVLRLQAKLGSSAAVVLALVLVVTALMASARYL